MLTLQCTARLGMLRLLNWELLQLRHVEVVPFPLNEVPAPHFQVCTSNRACLPLRHVRLDVQIWK